MEHIAQLPNECGGAIAADFFQCSRPRRGRTARQLAHMGNTYCDEAAWPARWATAIRTAWPQKSGHEADVDASPGMTLPRRSVHPANQEGLTALAYAGSENEPEILIELNISSESGQRRS